MQTPAEFGFTLEKMQEIAKSLTEQSMVNWTVKYNPVNEEGWPNRYAQFTSDSGLIFGSYMDTYKKKISVSGDYPKDADGCMLYTQYSKPQPPTINVSPQRTGQAIASDIMRRFMPEFSEFFHKLEKERQASVDYVNRKKQTAEKVAKVFQARPYNYTDSEKRYSFGDSSKSNWGEFVAYDDKVSIKLHSVTPEVAVKIAQALGLSE